VIPKEKLRKIRQDAHYSTVSPTADYSVCEGAGEVRREDNCHSEGDSKSPLALQSHIEVDELSVSTNPLPSGCDREIQCGGPALIRGKG